MGVSRHIRTVVGGWLAGVKASLGGPSRTDLNDMEVRRTDATRDADDVAVCRAPVLWVLQVSHSRTGLA